MLTKSKLKRTSVATLNAVFALAVLGASGLVLPNEHCRDEMTHTVGEAVEVGLLLAMVKTVVRLQKPVLNEQPLSVWLQFLRLLTATEVKFALAGGYALGLIKGCCHLAGW